MALKETTGKIDLTLVPVTFYAALKGDPVTQLTPKDVFLTVHMFYCRVSETTLKEIRNAIYSLYLKSGVNESDIIFEIAKVMQFGAVKYKRDNWAQGGQYSLLLGALERHLLQYSVDPIDKESGCNHLAHALCNVSFLIFYDSKKTLREKYDDRTTIYN